MVVPQDEAEWLYEYWDRRQVLLPRDEGITGADRGGVEIQSVHGDDVEADEEAIGVVQTPSEVDAEETHPRMSLSEIRRLVLLGQRGRQLAIGFDE